MSITRSKINDPESIYIPLGLRKGRRVELKGRVDNGAERFHINLQTEEDDNQGDIVLHFNPRQTEDVVVRNSRVCGGWQDEERDQPNFPFQRGQSFHLKIEVEQETYEIYVNGQYFVSYEMRMAPEMARFIHLSSGAEYYDLKIQDRQYLPYVAELPGGLKPGQALRVQGSCKEDGFSINFTQDEAGEINCFHFNPRPNEGCVVRNSKLDGGWGEEERDQESFPFQPEETFDATFVATGDSFVVYVNDEKYTSYNYRCPLEEAKYLHIIGDLNLSNVQNFEIMSPDFVKMIPSGLEKGDVLTFRGSFQPDGERFAINLMEDYETDGNIAFHFNPRRGEDQIVMNNKFEGSWNEEERVPLPDVFKSDYPFEVKIIVKRNKFKVYVDDVKVCKFLSRGNIEDIRGIMVTGSAYIYQAELSRKLNLPYEERIHGNLCPGNWVVIKGTPKKARGGFAINFKTGPGDEADIAFHFNPRLNENCVVRNTLSGGEWGMEEREQPCFPFEKKDSFEMAFCVLPGEFRVFVNRTFFTSYGHRLSVDSISHLEVHGEADIYMCEIY